MSTMAFQPETMERIKARWPLAMAGVYDQQLCANGDQTPPGAQRRHVFDFEDGIRLIASVDRIVHAKSGGRACDELHLSFSTHRPHGMFDDRVQEIIHALVGSDVNALTTFQTDRALHYWFALPLEVAA